MEQMLTDKGVVLLGEAAKMYVTYKYIDSILGFICLCIFGFGIYKLFKYVIDNYK